MNTSGKKIMSDPEELLEDFLEGYEDLPQEEALELLDGVGVDVETIEFLNGPVWVFSYDGERYVADIDDDMVSVSSLVNWLDNALQHSDDYVEFDEGLSTFWTDPGDPPVLYHATDEENVESILREGLYPEAETRGPANKWVGAAVYTSMDSERIHIYGDHMFAIDTAGMKRDGLHYRLAMEPGIVDYEQMQAIAHAVGEDEYPIDAPDDVEDYETIVIFGHIPPEYLSLVSGESLSQNPGVKLKSRGRDFHGMRKYSAMIGKRKRIADVSYAQVPGRGYMAWRAWMPGTGKMVFASTLNKMQKMLQELVDQGEF